MRLRDKISLKSLELSRGRVEPSLSMQDSSLFGVPPPGAPANELSELHTASPARQMTGYENRPQRVHAATLPLPDDLPSDDTTM